MYVSLGIHIYRYSISLCPRLAIKPIKHIHTHTKYKTLCHRSSFEISKGQSCLNHSNLSLEVI